MLVTEASSTIQSSIFFVLMPQTNMSQSSIVSLHQTPDAAVFYSMSPISLRCPTFVVECSYHYSYMSYFLLLHPVPVCKFSVQAFIHDRRCIQSILIMACQEIPPPVIVFQGHPNSHVQRCEGRKVDALVPWRTNNPNFPGNVTLQLRQPGDDFPTWDDTAPLQNHPNGGIYLTCNPCYRGHRNDASLAGWANYPHNSATPNLRRWARLCKRHALLVRGRDRPDPLPLRQGRRFETLPQNQQRRIEHRSRCDCYHRVYGAPANEIRICSGCADESMRALQDRADHWMRVLRHTHRRQVQNPRPIVEFNVRKKPARAKPACPYRNCGRSPWIEQGQSEVMGLSVCLACSTVVAS